jgi:hypothetical protein
MTFHADSDFLFMQIGLILPAALYVATSAQYKGLAQYQTATASSLQLLLQ